ncbi:DUF1080 domain-containing protein [Arenibacter sp. BSSL-BM3]|uniref:DUF1080 domain-containing protein n=1 Tax=Arenibacter arenosicollis TaxID=2762274 RepID=A0ABR7QNG7_9FLAO|nr:DUF1080 domain-containing protein [Arenibacter arenosicollis]MBC8768721.1 DUF1080 domain-containing protein [Arenibacter arenosicollis]
MKIKLAILLLFSGFSMLSQEQLSLENLNDFRDPGNNWKIVGDVVADRNITVHTHQDPEPINLSKKEKRRQKKSKETVHPIHIEPGTGVLFNDYSFTQKDHLLSQWEHGDIKLEMEILIPNGSNSGIYLQGRYELQIKDSWGILNPTSYDFGGIHRNWEEEPSKKFLGITPLSNPAKAPGLWQKIKIHFEAPKFNDSGEKIANAKFVSVTLNGVLIHSNVEVPLPTGGPISTEETAMGPLMIQGDHGPMAFRNINYQLLKESQVTLSDLSYITYKGDFKGLEELEGAVASEKQSGELIDINVVHEEDRYGITYTGKINIPEADDYLFSIGYTGGIDFSLDGKTIATNNSSDAQENLEKTVSLNAGEHVFTLTNIKNAGWRAPRLGLSIATASTNHKKFHVYDSYPPDISSVSPILVNAEATPRMLRGFVSFKGNEERLSHTIGLGTPEGINFVYDMGAENLIGMWRGAFVDATPMWHSRGNGSFKPNGAVQWTFLNQPLAELADLQSPFPKTGSAPDFKSNGYTMDPVNGLPIFKYTYKGVEVENKIYPNDKNTHLINEVSFSQTGKPNWYYKIASGKAKKLADGSFDVDNHQFYVKVLSGQEPILREVNDEAEIIIPVDGSTIKYEIIW